MLKRNKNWRNYRFFCHIFHWWILNWGGGGPPAPSPCLRLCSKWGKQKRCSQNSCEVSDVYQKNFNCSKNSAVLEPKTGQFLKTWGFEAKAKAKDLTFEAKAKDFKMCPRGRPRGQGRPRGLHLWCKFLMVFLFWKEPISYRMLLWIVCKLSEHLCGLICAYILFACCQHCQDDTDNLVNPSTTQHFYTFYTFLYTTLSGWYW